MKQFVALLGAFLVCAFIVAQRYGAKQETRKAPDKDGWREPDYLLNDYAGGRVWATIGVLLYGGLLLGLLIGGFVR